MHTTKAPTVSLPKVLTYCNSTYLGQTGINRDSSSFRLRGTGMTDESHARIRPSTLVLSAHTYEVAVPLAPWAVLRLISTTSLRTSFPAAFGLLDLGKP
jgi:hypothetical protein